MKGGTFPLTNQKSSDSDSQEHLEEELSWIKQALGLTDSLKVVWTPDPTKDIAGEVKGLTVYLYETNFGDAMQTLKHELIDYAVSKTISPYKDMVNALMKVINEHAYQEKERLVERLCKSFA